MTIHQMNGIKNMKNITLFNYDGQDNSCNEQMFVQEWINSIQSFEDDFNAVNPIFFDGKFFKLYRYFLFWSRSICLIAVGEMV